MATVDAGHLELRDLVKVYDPKAGLRAVDNFSVDIAPGEFVTLLGPSGCGKTTVLRMIAGFETPTSGEILLDGSDLTAHTPDKRPISLVFQSYALFPHMSVADNVGYGLHAMNLSQAARQQRVDQALTQMGLGGLGDRAPAQLSGGQQQRVALARAMVTDPQVMLFDEPLSNLDATLREQMRLRIRQLQRELGATAVYVTHDQSEAMAMSDRIIVMNAGRIEQVASPMEVYNRPASAFVAGFVGRANLIDVDVHARDRTTGGSVVVFDEHLTVPAHPDTDTGPAVLLARPEALRITADEKGHASIAVTAFMGERVDYEVDYRGRTLLASVPSPDPDEVLAEGTRVSLTLPAHRGWLLPSVH